MNLSPDTELDLSAIRVEVLNPTTDPFGGVQVFGALSEPGNELSAINVDVVNPETPFGGVQVIGAAETGGIIIELPASVGPQGPQGPAGAEGPAGDDGTNGSNAFTHSASGFIVPAVGSSVQLAVQDAMWIVPGQFLWIQGAGGAPDKPGVFQVIDKSGNNLTLLNPAGQVTEGPAGPAGTPGEKWYQGMGPPPDPFPGANPSDQYLDVATGDVYELGATTLRVLK